MPTTFPGSYPRKEASGPATIAHSERGTFAKCRGAVFFKGRETLKNRFVDGAMPFGLVKTSVRGYISGAPGEIPELSTIVLHLPSRTPTAKSYDSLPHQLRTR
jgi:hypothetical protein